MTVDTVIFDSSALMQNGQLRPYSRAVVAALQTQGCHLYLTGADPVQLADLAHRFKISANHVLETNQQVNLIRGLQNQGRTVAMVAADPSPDCGFVEANLSILVGAPDSMAEATADVILLEADLRGLLYGKAIAHLTLEKIYQNTAIIVVPNLLMQIGGGMILGVNPSSM